MILYINEKLLSLHQKFYVTDETNMNIYEISSKVISLGDKTYIKNLMGEDLAYIEQQLFHLTPNYNVYISGNLVCNISKKIQLFKNDYSISNGYKVEGDFLSLNFSIYDENNSKIGEVNKKFFSIGDKYELTIYDDNNTILLLSILVAIANDINRKQRNNSN